MNIDDKWADIDIRLETGCEVLLQDKALCIITAFQSGGNATVHLGRFKDGQELFFEENLIRCVKTKNDLIRIGYVVLERDKVYVQQKYWEK